MSLKSNTLRDAIALALVVAGTAAAGGVNAQETPAGSEATTLDRINVTGTRIRQVDTETAQPVVLIDRATIERQGFQSVADILQNISAVGTPPISRASPLSAGENAGGTFISLRNLGAERSLVLVNGRRMGISTSGLADISQIPAVAVERIEVLKDGASSIYGSDAIAGVINIITRSNYEGAAASAYYGQYSEGDGAITKGDFILGFSGDRGSLTVAAEYAKEDQVRSADRPYSAFPRSSLHPTDNWTAVGQFGGFVSLRSDALPGVVYPAPTAATPNPSVRVVGNPDGSFSNQNTAVGGCTPATLAAPGPGVCVPGSIADKSNTNLQTDLRTPLEKKSFYVDGVFDVTDDVRFRTNLLYSNRVSDRTVAGYPMQAASFNTPMAATSEFNPVDRPITNWWRRTWEVPRISSADLTTYRFLGALEGSFEIGDRFFDWDVSYTHNTNKLVQDSYGNLNLANVRAAVGPSFVNTAAGPTQGQVVCGAPGAIIAGCVPWNPFLEFGAIGPGGLTGNPALQNYLFQNEHSTGETKTNVFSANIAGTAFTLPAGDLGFAVGVETRKEQGEFVPDALAVTGGSTNLAGGPTGGGYRVNEIYGELEIPLLADLPFARELSLNVASRYSDYDTFGDTTNDKIGFKWKPFDSLLLRATVADGFRAPTISNLFGGGSQTFTNYTDPCDTNIGSSANNAVTRANCLADLGAIANTFRQVGQGNAPVTAPNQQTPIAFTSGSNSALTPEQSKSQTIGFVWSPTFAEGLNLALDWWKIRISDTIVTDAPTNILNDCYIRGDASRCEASAASAFTRDPVTGQINSFRFSSINAGFRKVEGFDFDISYRHSTENYGNFALSSNSTYTAKDYFTSTNTPQFPTSSVGFTSTFRIRSNFNLSWDMGDFGVSWTARYYSSMKEGCTYFTPSAAGVPPATEPHLECNAITYAPTGGLLADGVSPASGLSRRREVGSNTFNDVQIRYNAPWDATIAIGANNVFDKVGPVMYTQPSANVSYYGGFDIGRFLYMKYTQRF